MALKPITAYLKEEAFQKAASQLAAAIERADLDLTKVATTEGIDRRTIGRWVDRAKERGVDVIALARVLYIARGKDPNETLADKIRQGHERDDGDDKS